MERIIVGFSGGVDSATTAALLLQRGFEVYGVILKLWKMPVDSASDPITPARNVASSLNIPLIEVDLREKFFQEIVVSFAKAYHSGVTPNPCVICNPTVKFNTLQKVAKDIGARWIATGHYARIVQAQDRAHLFRGRTRNKDQSYALYRLDQACLQQLLLPLGEYPDKEQVRELARDLNLPNAEQSDSQDLCFMGGNDYRSLLEYLNQDFTNPGPILNEKGETLGRHQGLAFYTIGQRSGLGISSSERLYVIKLDKALNAVILGPRSSLNTSQCTLQSVTFTAGWAPASTFSAMGQYRYHSREVPIEVNMIGDSEATITFSKPQNMIAPGQSLVFYQEDEVIGGGIIARYD